MSIFLREPNPGDRISANLIKDIIRAVKELRPIAGHGMKLKRSPNGTTYSTAQAKSTSSCVATSSSNGVFEPIFSERDKKGGEVGEKEKYLSEVGPGIFPYGRNFYSGVTISDDAKVAAGFIGIKISHRGNSSSVSAKIVKIDDSYKTVSQIVQPSNADGRATTVLPLYTIDSGKIVIDCRCLLSLAVRE